MDKPNSFSWKYLFAGEGIKDWWKALGALWRIVVIIIIFVFFVCGFVTLKNVLFPPPGDNVHKPWIIALPGSTVTNPDLHSEQKMEQKKRPWWMPIPYIFGEGAVRTRSSGGGGIKFDDWEPEVRAGVGLRIDL